MPQIPQNDLEEQPRRIAWFQSIRFRTSLLAWIVSTVTIGLFALLVLPNLKQLLIHRLATTAEVVATSIEQVTVTSIVVEDYSSVIDHCMKVVKERPSVIYTVISRRDGFSLIARATGWRHSNLGGTWVDGQVGGRFVNNEFSAGEAYQYSHHLVYSGIDWGWIHIGLSTASFESDLWAIYQRLGMIGLFCVLGGWVVAMYFGRRLTFPLLALDRTARRIAQGDLSARAEVMGDDEVGSLAISFDRMTDELVRARDSLEERVNARTAELRSMNQRLISEMSVRREAEEARSRAERELEEQRALMVRSDRLRSLGEMAAGIAHELNQPLVTVRGAAEHILIGMDEGWEQNAERARDRLTRIVEQSDRMVHIIEHVRMFAREAGKPEVSPVDLNDVTRSSLDLLEAQFRSHGIELQFDPAPNLPLILGNPFSIEEVFLNLLNNARDAVESGSGVDREPGWVRVRTLHTASDDGTRVQVEIEDNGEGMSPEVLSRIWDPFFTTKDPDKGTGLGLSISRSIVEGFGGDLIIESEHGVGTRAIVSLEASEATVDPRGTDSEETLAPT